MAEEAAFWLKASIRDVASHSLLPVISAQVVLSNVVVSHARSGCLRRLRAVVRSAPSFRSAAVAAGGMVSSAEAT